MEVRETKATPSLNPYSIGCWSMTTCIDPKESEYIRLNPYSIGCWSMTIRIVGCNAYVLMS